MDEKTVQQLIIGIVIGIVLFVLYNWFVRKEGFYTGYNNTSFPCEYVKDPYWRYYCYGGRHL